MAKNDFIINGQNPVYPIENVSNYDYRGLSKREIFAMAAMQGLCSDGKYTEGRAYNPHLVNMAIEIADELLKQLES